MSTLSQRDPAKCIVEGHPDNVIEIPAKKPDPTSAEIGKAITILQAQQEQLEKAITLDMPIEGYDPIDVAVNFYRLLGEEFGLLALQDTPTFFGPVKPKMVTVRTGYKSFEQEQIILGRMGLPILDKDTFLEIKFDLPNPDNMKKRPKFVLGGTIKGKHRDLIDALAAKLRDRMKTHSIYRGKAIETDFSWHREQRGFDPATDCPRFMDPSSANEETLFFSDTLMARLRAKLWFPLLNFGDLSSWGLKSKRGILLYGPPGTGKTEIFRLGAKKATSRGVTVFHCRSTSDLQGTIALALLYQPALITVEDIDKTTTGNRDEEMDRLSNAIDGTEIKGSDIVILASTNDVDSIKDYMLRSGRFGDGLIQMEHPNADAVAKMILHLTQGQITEDFDVPFIAKMFADVQTPASEIVGTLEGARLYALSRSNGTSVIIDDEDVLFEFKDREHQRRLLTPKPVDNRPDILKSASIYAKALVEAAKIRASAVPPRAPSSNLEEAAAAVAASEAGDTDAYGLNAG